MNSQFINLPVSSAAFLAETIYFLVVPLSFINFLFFIRKLSVLSVTCFIKQHEYIFNIKFQSNVTSLVDSLTFINRQFLLYLYYILSLVVIVNLSQIKSKVFHQIILFLLKT